MSVTTTKQSKFQLQSGDLCFTFLSSGDLYNATSKSIMINQWLSNCIDGSLNNLYLRLFTEEGTKVVPLVGVKSSSTVHFGEKQIRWNGTAEKVNYEVIFTLTEQNAWFWEVNVEGQDVEIDVIYGQDLGMSSTGAILNNQAYVAQYLDHNVFQTNNGHVLCSRQTQPQQEGFPYIQQGSITRNVGYSTDGFQFFGHSYKETNKPEALYADSLANEIYQYEFSYTALQSERITLSGSASFVFYGIFQINHPEAITTLEYQGEVASAWAAAQALKETNLQSPAKISLASNIGSPLMTESISLEEIYKQYPNRCQEEWEGDELLSFFTDTHEHVVLKSKELIVERPHGHILMTGQNDTINGKTLATTSYMYGIFNAQLVIGNTSFNKMLSNVRNHLNVMKTSGQRIYVLIDGKYQLLTMPSLFEIGFNYTRWVYKTDEETFVITNFTVVDSPEAHLNVRAESGKSYQYIVTNQVVMQGNEYEVPFHMSADENTLTFTADKASMSGHTYPKLSYRMRVQGATMNVTDETALVPQAEALSASLVVLELEASNEWTISIQGSLEGEKLDFVQRDFTVEKERYREFYRDIMNGFELSLGTPSKELDKFNTLAWWYTHNMLVHFSMPHGLEQFGGAAWGARDVCQGPFEYFMVTQRYESVKEVIRTLYSHQFIDNGNWPQWFMFDNYYRIQAGESHGDIIVWPLKVLGDYLAVTNDYSILDEEVSWMQLDNKEKTSTKSTIWEHAKKAIEYIKQHFLHDTHLSAYDDGDWDDTLQPANQQLRQYMASSWTVALTYQVVRQLARVMKNQNEAEANELSALADGIEKDFNEYMIKDGVISGFVYMEDPEQIELMVHPQDTKTGIHYRLIPMTRSMISELLTPEQADSHYKLIKEQLFCPDGVRLMNRPANYAGGVSTHFKRAEQGANFGREIGLQYVHAHIRFIEAMAKLGKPEEVWNGLAVINPVGIRDAVPNAERRQSNSYFSSSDGKFNTRYDAQENFHKLRDGSVAVKGGWRIYSSGPGIYMNQLISNALGIRQLDEGLVIDPILPADFDGLEFNFKVNGKAVTFKYHLAQADRKVTINGEAAHTEDISNRYRAGGYYIAKEELELKLQDGDRKSVV